MPPRDDTIYHRIPEIDERWIQEWLDYGLEQLGSYLGKHARFADYYRRRQAAAATPASARPSAPAD